MSFTFAMFCHIGGITQTMHRLRLLYMMCLVYHVYVRFTSLHKGHLVLFFKLIKSTRVRSSKHYVVLCIKGNINEKCVV